LKLADIALRPPPAAAGASLCLCIASMPLGQFVPSDG